MFGWRCPWSPCGQAGPVHWVRYVVISPDGHIHPVEIVHTWTSVGWVAQRVRVSDIAAPDVRTEARAARAVMEEWRVERS